MVINNRAMEIYSSDITTIAAMEKEIFNVSTNASDEAMTHASAFDIALAVFELILLVLICFGNGLVIAAFYRTKRLHTVTNYFIMNLSVADFCVGVLMLLHAILFLCPQLVSIFYVCIVRYSTLMTMMGTSTFCLVALSYDRYVAIVKPLHYHGAMTRKKVALTFLFVWLAPIIGAFIVPFVWNNKQDFLTSNDCDFTTVLTHEYIRYILLPCFLICTVIIIYFYICIFYVARKHITNIQRMDSQLQAERKFRKTVKLTQTAAIVLGVFFASWLPFIFLVILQEYFGVNTKIIIDVRTWAVLLAVLNSGFNPIIYAFRLRSFQREFKRILHIKSGGQTDRQTSQHQQARGWSTRLKPRLMGALSSSLSDIVVEPPRHHILQMSANLMLTIAGITPRHKVSSDTTATEESCFDNPLTDLEEGDQNDSNTQDTDNLNEKYCPQNSIKTSQENGHSYATVVHVTNPVYNFNDSSAEINDSSAEIMNSFINQITTAEERHSPFQINKENGEKESANSDHNSCNTNNYNTATADSDGIVRVQINNT